MLADSARHQYEDALPAPSEPDFPTLILGDSLSLRLPNVSHDGD
jgi:hypothetical protein